MEVEEMKKILKKRITTDLKPWKKTDKEKINRELEKYYQKNKFKQILVKLEIVNNNLKRADFSHIKSFYVTRANAITRMIKFCLSKTKQNFDDIIFYITMKDTIIDDKLPILGYSKQMDQIGLLFPDWTFQIPYKSEINTYWHNQIREIDNKCSRINFDQKEDVIFFQGQDTSKGFSELGMKFKTNIRRNLKTIAEENNQNQEIPMEILIDDEPKTRITTWCNNKYLLDLPGAHFWSVRFKELMLTGSITIKVDNLIPNINFYSDIFKAKKDYVQVFYTNAENQEEKYKNAEKCYHDIYQEINKLTPEKIKSMITSSREKIVKMDNRVLNYYIETMLEEYQKTFLM